MYANETIILWTSFQIFCIVYYWTKKTDSEKAEPFFILAVDFNANFTNNVTHRDYFP